MTDYIPKIRERVAARTYSTGLPMSDADVMRYQDILDNAGLIDQQQKASKLSYPDITFEDKLTIWSGDREIRLIHLGRSNTAGDVIMYLPTEKIIATGDIDARPPLRIWQLPRRMGAIAAQIETAGSRPAGSWPR